MKVENYKRIDGWLNVRVNPIDNQSLYDFSEYVDGVYHTLSESHELYNKYINNQPERLNPEDQLSGNSGKLVCDSLNSTNK
jgi:hypothetical protein